METQSKSSVIKWFSPLLTTAILLLIFHATEAKDCQLVGPGACRGLKWSEGTWPQLVQDRTIDECCTLCKSTRSCTAFSVGKGTKPKKPCFLYNHKDIQPASGLGGECYKIIEYQDTSEESLENQNGEHEDSKLDLSLIGKQKQEAPKVKKAKKKLKKILDAQNFTVESKKESDDNVVEKKAKIQANKRDVNAKRIARVSKVVQNTETKNNISNDDDDTSVDTDEGEKPKKIVKETEKKAKKPKVEKVEKKEKVEEKPVKKAEPKPEKPEKPAKPAEKTEAKVDKPEQKDKKEKPKEPVKKADKPAEKPDKPVEKPDKPAEKPDKPVEKPEKKPKEKQQKPEKKPEKKPEQPEKKEEKPKEPEKPKAKAEKPAAKQEEKPVVKKSAPKLYNGKKLIKIGEGGCRGSDWNRKGCPKLLGRYTLDDCASECAKTSYCTAFHILKFDAKDGKYDCLLFAHKNILAVKGLGGLCYSFQGQDEQVEEEEDRQIDGPVRMIEIGPGMCRGKGWQDGKWPLDLNSQTAQGCADACAKKKGCTAFDLSAKKGKTYDCHLYGHKDVEPAKALKGQCFTYVGNEETEALANEEHLDEIEDQADEGQDTEPAKFTLIGKGQCRGPLWTSAKWPVDKGTKIRQKCANACKNRKGCVAFDLSPPEANEDKEDVKKGELQCNLFGHAEIIPATALKGNCYRLSGAEPIIEKAEESKATETIKKVINDGSLAKLPKTDEDFDLVGHGLCRGKGWQRGGVWPKDEGQETFDRCALQCKKDKACTAFDVSPSEFKGKFRCLNYGHDKVKSTDTVSLPGRCYKMKGRKAMRNVKPKATFDKEGHKFLGKGMCRGEDWQNEPWPIIRGKKTLDECYEVCKAKQGCTAFEIGLQKKSKCILYGHDDVEVATSMSLQNRKCYKIPGKLAITVGKKAQKADLHLIKSVVPEHVDSSEIIDLGSGLCRGPKWQRNNWPKDEGYETFEGCLNECKKLESCTAFDISPSEVRDKFRCYLFGHGEVVPATATTLQASHCYKMAGRKAIAGASPPKPKAKPKAASTGTKATKGKKPYTMIGKGLCRGENWQLGKWPKDEGYETLETCSMECQKRPGCTGFDLTPSEDLKGKFRCILHGHKDIEVADATSLQISKCYRMVGGASKGQKAAAQPQEKAETKAVKGSGYDRLGRGLCRGDNWQNDMWPKFEGLETEADCAKECQKDKGCTAFSLWPSEVKGKYMCVLYGHDDIDVADASTLQQGKCFKMQGRSSAGGEEDHFHGRPFIGIGKGLCRGEDWQDNNWPLDGKFQTVEGCFEVCSATPGCNAFDLSEYDKKAKKARCWLHRITSELELASALDGKCYRMAKGADEAVEGLLKIGQGACRGEGWQAKKGWPKIKGLQTLMQCSDLCANTLGCTAFDVRAPDGAGAVKKLECTLYAHSDVEPASAVPGTCYRVTASFNLQKIKKAENAMPTQEKAAKKAKKKYVVPQFDEPEVLQDEPEAYEEEPLFDPPPKQIRSRAHIEKILGTGQAVLNENLVSGTLKELKKIYTNSILPLESAYKYRELSHRHFGDPEMLSKPLIVLMGPWSGGKSTMINYILGNEFNQNAFKSGVNPTEGFNFNIAMYGETEEEIEGTELAAEFSFSSLQKFGQDFLEKLRGKKLNNPLLKKATFAEIPGLLETGSKKIDRKYPFNDACQWFIDHADLILLVYDYTKLDIGPEAEALLDQLKGRESQVRIILNKADEITATELFKIQNNLVWNVSPHMATLEPPRLYAGSFWSHPYKDGAPKELLQNQEASLLRDIRDAMNKRVENRIATARRFAVRVRNHAKMVDVYLATVNSKKGLFGNAKATAEDVVNHPNKYHIYDGISRMTNISRYDLPDPHSYQTFFGLHPLTEFPSLQSTCTYFQGCPLNKMDVAIAYELPELLTDYKRKKHGKVASVNTANDAKKPKKA